MIVIELKRDMRIDGDLVLKGSHMRIKYEQLLVCGTVFIGITALSQSYYRIIFKEDRY